MCSRIQIGNRKEIKTSSNRLKRPKQTQQKRNRVNSLIQYEGIACAD